MCNSENYINDENRRGDLHEMIKLMVQAHDTCIKERSKLQTQVYYILCIPVAFSGAYLGYWMHHSLTTWQWICVSMHVLTTTVMVWALRHNGKRLRAHRAARKNLIGIMNSPPHSIASEHHLSQARTAVRELMGFNPKKYADKTKNNVAGGGNP